MDVSSVFRQAPVISDFLPYLCSSTALSLQVQCCVILLLLSIGWLFAAKTRSSALRQLCESEEQGSGLAFLGPSEVTNMKNPPMVSVVMPVKGLSEHTLSNWRTQLSPIYPGPVEFLFVVESDEDEAYTAVTRLAADLEGEVRVKCVVAGFASTCSQKVQNQLAGVGHVSPASHYILFLDDDIRLHPGTITSLVSIMLAEPSLFMVTGYPFDIPSSTLGSHCAQGYHLPLSIAYATGKRTSFVWGGCMLMHAADWKRDMYGMATALKNGGYSDDMTLGALAGLHGRNIEGPSIAVFLHPLGESFTMAKYWNYLRRQIFCLRTYTSSYNRFLNTMLVVVHCWLSWGLTLPLLPSFLHLLTLLPLPGKLPASAGSVSPAAACPAGSLLSMAVLACGLLATMALHKFSGATLQLCNKLSPESRPVTTRAFRWHMVVLGVIVGEFLYPICAIYTWFKNEVEWSGVRYIVKAGKICKVKRARVKGHAKTDPLLRKTTPTMCSQNRWFSGASRFCTRLKTTSKPC